MGQFKSFHFQYKLSVCVCVCVPISATEVYHAHTYRCWEKERGMTHSRQEEIERWELNKMEKGKQ